MKIEIIKDGVLQPMELFIALFHVGLIALILTIIYLGLVWMGDLYQLYYPEEVEAAKTKLNSPAPLWSIFMLWVIVLLRTNKGNK